MAPAFLGHIDVEMPIGAEEMGHNQLRALHLLVNRDVCVRAAIK